MKPNIGVNNAVNSGVIAWFTRNPVAANLLMFIILIFGAFTVSIIRTEAFPSFPADSVTVRVDFIGGSPQEVEEGVAVKIEEALNGVEGIQEISSSITPSGATVTVSAEEGYDLSQLKDDVKLKIDGISNFPELAEQPVITEQLRESRVLSIELFGPVSLTTLKETAERLRDELLTLPNLNKININGARDYEINIEVSERILREYNLSMEEIARAVRNNSVNLSSGRLRTDGAVISVRAENQAYYGQQFEDIVIRQSSNGGQLTLGEIATVKDDFTEADTFNRFNGQPSVQIEIRLLSRDSITAAAEAVKTNLQELQNQSWFPKEIETAIWNDESIVIQDRLSLMAKNAISGILLVLIMLTLFLNIRVAFWVSLGIPIAFAGALFLMGPLVSDLSLNVLTTFGFIVVLGIVVDDAIVIGESIYSHKQKNGADDPDPVATTIIGTQKVAVPATFGVLTTVAAFFPLTLIASDLGEIFGLIAAVVIFCLLFSLVESKWILPAHLAHIRIDNDNSKKASAWRRFQNGIDRRLQNFIKKRYLPMLDVAVRHKFTTLALFTALFILVVGLIPGGLVRVSFFPDIQSETSVAALEMQQGTGSDMNDQVTAKIEQAAFQINQQAQELFNYDKEPIQYVYAFSEGDESSKTYIQLNRDPDRNFLTQDLINQWRDNIGSIAGVKSLEIYSLGPGSGQDLQVELSSNDFQELADAADDLRQKLSQYEGVYDLKTSYDEGNPELQIELTDQAQALGLTYNDIATQLRYAIFGFEAQRIQRGRDEIRVKVRYPEHERNQISDLQEIRIRTPEGGSVPLQVVAELNQTSELTTIDRIDKKRVVFVSGRTDKSVVSASEVLNDLSADYFPQLKQQYASLDIQLAGESEEQRLAITSLIQGFLLSLFLIYTLLAIPLKSYVQPLVIMGVIPFGIIGAILGHLIVGIPIGLLSFFGILALSGVVVNDSLVLVKRYNEQRESGRSHHQAILDAGAARFRAILLTSITTFMGLSPLIFESSLQAQFLIPMAVSLAFGILFATVITLLIIPTLLSILHSMKSVRSSEPQTAALESTG